MKVPQAIRYALQAAPKRETDVSLARKFNLDARTVSRWRSRSHVLDLGRAPHRQGRRKLEPVEVALLCAARLGTGWPLDRLLAVFTPRFVRPVTRQQAASILSARGLRRPPAPRRVPRPAAYLTYFFIVDAGQGLLMVESCFFPSSGELSFFSRRIRSRKEITPAPSASAHSRIARLPGKARVYCSRHSVASASAFSYRRPWWWKTVLSGKSEDRALPLFDLSIPGAVLTSAKFARNVTFRSSPDG